MIYIDMPTYKKEKINCWTCGGSYLNCKSHKMRHEVSNKHRLALYESKEKQQDLMKKELIIKLI
jgi:hypothetical protein